MSAVRAVIRALVLQSGWDEVNEIVQSEKMHVSRRKSSLEEMESKLRAVAPRPTNDLDRARAKAALRKLGKL